MPTLTDKSIQSLEPPTKGRRLVFDDHRDAPRGFGVRVNAGGKRSFVLRYNAGGKDRMLTIGEHGPNRWSLAAARKRAGELRRQIDGGEDIVAKRREERAEPTLADVVEQYSRAHLDRLATGPDIRTVFRKYLLPALGQRKIAHVRRRDVIEILEPLGRKHGRQASRLLTYIKHLFTWAEDRELIEANPVATLKPAKITPEMAANKRARVLTEAELRTFWNNVEACGMARLTALALKLVLVTGQRPGEVAGMAWREVEGSTWTIPATRRGKTDSSHAVPLTYTAAAILEGARAETERLSRRRTEPSAGYVFEARPGTPIDVNSLSRAVKRFLEPLGNQADPDEGHWRPHDLRRTMRTGLAAAGVDDLVAEATIGHTRQGIAAVYDQHKYDREKRQALETWERRLLHIVAGKDPDADNVVELVAREP